MNSIEHDDIPLFQLNLMIFLSWPSPKAFIKKPVLRKAGFKLYRLNPIIPTADEVRLRAEAATPSISMRMNPTPDLLFYSEHNNHVLLVECKTTGFGLDTGDKSRVSQANAMLSLSGFRLATRFVWPDPDSWKSSVIYAVSDGKHEWMHNTLIHLKGELEKAKIETAGCASILIDIMENGVYLETDPRASLPIQEIPASPDKLCVIELEPDEDPRTLYVVPWDPTLPDDALYGHRVIEERVRTVIASLIMSQLPKIQFTIKLSDVITQSIELWEAWRDNTEAQDQMKNAIKSYLKQIIKQVGKLGVHVDIKANEVNFSRVNAAHSKALRKYFKGSKYNTGVVDLWSEAVQLDFSSLDANWSS